jgi:hypothetical protein
MLPKGPVRQQQQQYQCAVNQTMCNQVGSNNVHGSRVTGSYQSRRRTDTAHANVSVDCRACMEGGGAATRVKEGGRVLPGIGSYSTTTTSGVSTKAVPCPYSNH